ncbi:MAG: hypothetical protein WCP01_04070 [Methylococcaceae bacterium]
MHQYSPYFKTLHNEVAPVGYIGRGSHYTILRCVIWHDHMLIPLQKGKYLDFAIIWDEDHDERIISIIEDLYINGLLSPVIFVGETKGIFSLLTHKPSILTPEYGNSSEFQCAIQNISEKQEDSWPANIFQYLSTEHTIISDSYERVSLYLENLKQQWQLGIKDVNNNQIIDSKVGYNSFTKFNPQNQQVETNVIKNLFDDFYNSIDAEPTSIDIDDTANILHGTRIQALANFKKAGYYSVQDGRSKKSTPKQGQVPYDAAASFFNNRFLTLTKTRHLIAEEIAKLTGQSCAENRQFPPNETQRAENLKQQIFCLNHFLKTGEYSTNVYRSKQNTR